MSFWKKYCAQNDFSYLKIMNIHQIYYSIVDYYAFNTLGSEKLTH
jgi:hypothetical protein